MAFSFQYKRRLLVPIWRKFSETVGSNELNSVGTRKNLHIGLDNVLIDWVEDKNIITASEVINSALSSKVFNLNEFEEAKYLLENHPNPPSLLVDLISKNSQDNQELISEYLSNAYDLMLEDIDSSNIDDIWSRISVKSINSRINQLKYTAREYASDPVTWVDMSLLYTTKGQYKKAERAMTVALGLAPDNRYVLRSATCLFVHLGDGVKALYYLKKSSRTALDPWLTSAHIAASRWIDRYSPYIKYGKSMILDKNISSHNITELASSIGTEEYNSGGIKKSMSLFNLALKSPNDNTIAQVEWISQKEKSFRFNPMNYSSATYNCFEARALDAREKQMWEDAIINGVKWFLEMPYSRESILFCVFLLTTVFQKHEEALKFCKVGLKIHPNDPTLINNLFYLYLMCDNENEIVGLRKQFLSFDIENLSVENKVAHTATKGLLFFKTGNMELGESMYKLAVSIANKNNKQELGYTAYLNLAREVFNYDLKNKREYIAGVKKISQDTKDSISKYVALEMIKDLEKFK